MRLFALALVAVGCAEPEPADQVDDPCEAVRGGPGGADSVPVDLSAAHAGVRLFAPEGDWLAADAALAAALEGDAMPITPDILDAYAEALPSVCSVPSSSGSLGQARVSRRPGVAVIVPGTGDLDVPAGAHAIVVDLRDVPQSDGTWDAVAAAAGTALAGDVLLGLRSVRQFEGFPQQDGASPAYSTRVAEVETSVQGTADADLPLIFWTSQRTAPDAAAIAAGLRLQGRAWIVGYDLFAAVAESEWTGIGDDGLAWRGGTWMFDEDVAWPDAIPADVSTSTPERADLRDLGLDVPAVDGEATRSMTGFWNRLAGQPPESSTRGTMRAALIVAHGTFQRFYPYFEDVGGDTTDEALLAALTEVDASTGDRVEFLHTLGRFMHALHDGHGQFGDFSASKTVPTGYLALQIEDIAGEPVVRASAEVGVDPGDTITAVDGVPAADWFAETMARYSAASDGFLFNWASREMLWPVGPRTLDLRDPDGATSTVTLPGAPVLDYAQAPWGGTHRPSGFLGDLGAPTIYLLNLNGEVTTDLGQVETAFAEAASASGLVVDMRDYPEVNQYVVAGYLWDVPFRTPQFVLPVWTGPDALELVMEDDEVVLGDTPFTGPIVLIVGHKTMSAAENFAQMFYWRDNVTVVGQHTGGTNGNITATLLPGAFFAEFTSMRVLDPVGSPDEAPVHVRGIPVEVEVTPVAAEFRDGVDPELMEAIDVLTP